MAILARRLLPGSEAVVSPAVKTDDGLGPVVPEKGGIGNDLVTGFGAAELGADVVVVAVERLEFLSES